MSVYYQNGPEITKITRRGLNSLSMLISRKQYRISAAQLTDKFAWADIYGVCGLYVVHGAWRSRKRGAAGGAGPHGEAVSGGGGRVPLP